MNRAQAGWSGWRRLSGVISGGSGTDEMTGGGIQGGRVNGTKIFIWSKEDGQDWELMYQVGQFGDGLDIEKRCWLYWEK